MANLKNISKEDIEKAIAEINPNDIPNERKSYIYYLKSGDKLLPPKYVLSIANKYSYKEELNSDLFNAVEAKNYLKKLGFEIITKESLSENTLIQLLRLIGNTNAMLFFKTASELVSNIDVQINDKRITYGSRKGERLSITIGQRYCLAIVPSNDKPWRFILSNEIAQGSDVEISNFDGMPTAIYCKCNNSIEMSNHISDIISASKKELEKTTQSGYKKFNDDLFERAIFKGEYRDELFSKAFDEECNYWIFQGNPDAFDFETAIRENLLDDWTVTAHKDKIKTGDKVILWITGKKAGCYALAEITYEPMITDNSKDAHLWKTENKNNLKAGIKITDNLIDHPIFGNEIKETKGLEKLKVGSQGTNFTATKEEYDIIKIKIMNSGNIKNRKSIYDTLRLKMENAGFEFETEQKAHRQNREEMELKFIHTQLIKKLETNGYTLKAKKFYIKPLSDEPNCEIGFVTGKSSPLSNAQIFSPSNTIDSYDNSPAWTNREGDTALDNLLESINNYINNKENSMKSPLNIILYGPPGTGKTYNSIDKAVEIAKGASSALHSENKKQFDILRNNGQIEFVTFHQNYSYEDFMIGISPDITSGTLRFDKKEGIFKKISDRAKLNWILSTNKQEINFDFTYVFNTFFAKVIEEEINEIEIPMKSKGYKFKVTSIDVDEGRIKFKKQSGGTGHDLLVKNIKAIYEGTLDYGFQGLGIYYNPLVEQLKQFAKTLQPQRKGEEQLKLFVLIIDEINRANISKVFGELITLLEDDKRLGAENELKITLPNGEKEFGVPPNLYIIGTMNTADKSIALIDIALRRRFEFLGKYPDYTKLEGEEKILLEKINKAIFENKKSADYLIGHAYFMKKQPIKDVLKNKVIPLLMEYFSGKTDIVSKIFADTNWKVEYDIVSYNWKIEGA